jgi:hypothetical protein
METLDPFLGLKRVLNGAEKEFRKAAQMATHYHALRTLKSNSNLKEGDVLVLFGELFTRGYANGLVEEAERLGMTIVRSTVGRRDKDNTLRALNEEETASIPKPFINIPLEAGFDLEPAANGVTPVEQIKDVKLNDWSTTKLDFTALAQSQKSGEARFRKAVQAWTEELSKHIPPKANVVFAHLMAGGVPRAKIVMPLMNRSVKGTGERYLPSEDFWRSDIGKFCSLSFQSVTAQTFDILLTETAHLRESLTAQGGRVSYLAYGYHGTEVLVGHNYLWQTYTPYLQGWAKLQLESLAAEWTKRGAVCCVYNCPEILTNSTTIFQGVEVSLYPLLGALQKEAKDSKKARQVLEACAALLKPEFTFEKVLQFTQAYLTNPIIRDHCNFERWPQHSSKAQLELMLTSSDQMQEMHLDGKKLMTALLSEVVFTGCGKMMLADVLHPEAPVAWINHDIIAKCATETA